MFSCCVVLYRLGGLGFAGPAFNWEGGVVSWMHRGYFDTGREDNTCIFELAAVRLVLGIGDNVFVHCV